MTTLQHFLLFLIQFVFVSGISLVTISFVNYVIPSQQFQGIATSINNDSDLIRSRSTFVILDTTETPIKPNNVVDLPLDRAEAIVNIDPVVEDISQIDITNITLRTARKIAKPLGIKQKVNGKDAPKSWLIAQIEQKLREEPDTTKTVAELLAA